MRGGVLRYRLRRLSFFFGKRRDGGREPSCFSPPNVPTRLLTAFLDVAVANDSTAAWADSHRQ